MADIVLIYVVMFAALWVLIIRPMFLGAYWLFSLCAYFAIWFFAPKLWREMHNADLIITRE